ncbi:MAG: tRNA (adenosine(37)-N6)-threonylcarbamoyltransferase complex dimerization subunit type 1 TsaB [Thermoanaerobaculia bacterium]
MSIWLAFDGCSPVTSAAVARDGELLGASAGESRTGPSLLEHLDLALRQSGLAVRDLDGAIALRGPGSFTGIRISLASALALRSAGGLRLWTMSNLAALAVQASAKLPASDTPQASPGAARQAGHPRVLALVDALRGEWFAQEFTVEGERLAPGGEPRRVPAQDLHPEAGAEIAHHEKEMLPAIPGGHPARPFSALAPAIAMLASRGRLGGLLSETMDPLYLRAFTPRSAAP